jgi:hypothetical protein
MNLAVVSTLIRNTLLLVTPEIRTEMIAVMDGLAAKAKATANPFDDIAVAILRAVLGF